MNAEQIDDLQLLAVRNGQLVLMRDVLLWAKANKDRIAKPALDELMAIAEQYDAA